MFGTVCLFRFHRSSVIGCNVFANLVRQWPLADLRLLAPGTFVLTCNDPFTIHFFNFVGFLQKFWHGIGNTTGWCPP